MILRDYQQRISNSVIREWQEVCSTLVVCPTGGGKTIIFADVIRCIQPARAMVIAHREELIFQARDKIQSLTGLECGIEMGDLYVNKSLFGDTPVIISTIQTQTSGFGDRRRMSRFKPQEFGVLIIDEAHHATAKTYRDLINYYKTNNPAIKILGVTATPDRTDEEALGQIFETCPDEQDYEILDAIKDGWLVPIDQLMVTLGSLDFSHVRTTCGDLNGADLSAVMESEKNIQGVVQPTLEAMYGLPPHSLDTFPPNEWPATLERQPYVRRGIVFTVSVAQAEALSNIFNRIHPDLSRWVCGHTNKDQRREMLKQFAAGQIQCVVNVGVLTEGFDDPGVELIAMGRPTESRALYSQCIGRAMRPLTGLVDGLATPEERKAAISTSAKKSMLVLDFVGNSGKHKLMSSADILGGKVSDEAIARAVLKAKSKGGAVRMSDELDEAEEELRNEAAARRQAEEARKSRLVARVSYTSRKISPFDALELTPVRERGWDSGKVLSEKQRSLLLKQGINPDDMVYAEAKQLLNEMFRRWDQKLATVKQASLLKRYGYETKELKMDEASRLIDGLAKNGWRRTDRTTHVPLLTQQPTEDQVPF